MASRFDVDGRGALDLAAFHNGVRVMSMLLESTVAAGTVLDFSYPSDNRIRVYTRLRRRRLVVEAVRDTERWPIPEWAKTMRPDLRRGRWLLIGRDLDCNELRQFYLTSARSIREIHIPVSQLAIYNPAVEDAELKFFGPLWTDSRRDHHQVREVIKDVNEMIERSGKLLSVALFPFQGGRHALKAG